MNRFLVCAFNVTLLTLPACGVEDRRVDDGEEAEDTQVVSSAISCSPRMSVFPVRGGHNIGYDAPSCGSGHCAETCPDEHANSDWGGGHHGIDVFAHHRAELQAVASGTIVAVGWPSSTSGLRVRLRDACGWEYYYGHLDQAAVRVGQHVSAGDLIGFMGATGTEGLHLHFNVSPDGRYSSDINPFNLLASTSPTACSGGGDGCGGQQRQNCANYGCACVDNQCNGGYCPGNGCTEAETQGCGAYGCGCVDHQCNGGFCDGSGCTAKETNDCGAYGCGCSNHGCSGGACPP